MCTRPDIIFARAMHARVYGFRVRVRDARETLIWRRVMSELATEELRSICKKQARNSGDFQTLRDNPTARVTFWVDRQHAGRKSMKDKEF